VWSKKWNTLETTFKWLWGRMQKGAMGSQVQAFFLCMESSNIPKLWRHALPPTVDCQQVQILILSSILNITPLFNYHQIIRIQVDKSTYSIPLFITHPNRIVRVFQPILSTFLTIWCEKNVNCWWNIFSSINYCWIILKKESSM